MTGRALEEFRPPQRPMLTAPTRKKYRIDWSTCMVTDSEGRVANLHAEFDAVRDQRRLALFNREILTGFYEGLRGKMWLRYKTVAEHEQRRISKAELDRMIDADMVTEGTAIREAWIALLGAQAEAIALNENYWALKRLVDIDDNSRT